MKKQSIKQIENQLSTISDESHPFLQEVVKDERKGVQNLLAKWKKEKERERFYEAKFIDMTQYERKYRAQGFQWIAGIDEVGRGPLAGPVVASAVILPEDFFLPGIDDSKKLSEKKREEYAEKIKSEAIAFSISMIDSEEIDRINIYEATKKAMLSAIASLDIKPDLLLIDAMKLETPYESESIIKGDAKSVSIAAASIVAKVARDRLMMEISASYPVYHFEQNMGYGTKEHIKAIEEHGITLYHRKSFAPIKDLY
jgi:ribonuclease HII